MLIADSAKVIRLPMDSMRIIGRNTQGVKMINLNEGEKVVALSMLARTDDEIDDAEDPLIDGEEELSARDNGDNETENTGQDDDHQGTDETPID